MFIFVLYELGRRIIWLDNISLGPVNQGLEIPASVFCGSFNRFMSTFFHLDEIGSIVSEAHEINSQHLDAVLNMTEQLFGRLIEGRLRTVDVLVAVGILTNQILRY
jgi:hypothetical protein